MEQTEVKHFHLYWVYEFLFDVLNLQFSLTLLVIYVVNILRPRIKKLLLFYLRLFLQHWLQMYFNWSNVNKITSFVLKSSYYFAKMEFWKYDI